MARCQAKLGQYVEAAENYRRLTRTTLSDNAPQAFKDAVADAKKELPDVEPKIASLRLEVQPAGIQGLEVKVDDLPVSVAALGVDRPTNPGTRRVTASAPGYAKMEKTIDLRAGEKKQLTLTLEATGAGEGGEGGAAGEGAGGTAGKGGQAGAEGGAAGTEGEGPSGNVGFMLGLRLGGFLPGGQLRDSYAMKDYFGAGAGVELRAGVRIFKHYTGLLLGSIASYQPGSLLDATNGEGSSATNKASGTDAGVGFMYSAEPGKLGPFAEIDLLFIHRFQVERDLELFPKVFGAAGCRQTVKAAGTGLRLGGGVQIPLASFFQLSPFAGVTVGQANDFENDDSDCEKFKDPKTPANPSDDLDDFFKDRTPWDKDAKAAANMTHIVVFLGVGGEFIFGSDKPRK
jgi:hypothetical protein